MRNHFDDFYRISWPDIYVSFPLFFTISLKYNIFNYLSFRHEYIRTNKFLINQKLTNESIYFKMRGDRSKFSIIDLWNTRAVIGENLWHSSSERWDPTKNAFSFPFLFNQKN